VIIILQDRQVLTIISILLLKSGKLIYYHGKQISVMDKEIEITKSYMYDFLRKFQTRLSVEYI